jgi:hypothetical protein
VPLPRRQQNELFRAVENAGLDPSNFLLTVEGASSDTMDGLSFTISHRSSSAYLDSHQVTDSLYWSAIALLREGDGRNIYVIGWTELKGEFSVWLGDVRSEFEEPNLWAELERQRSILTAVIPSENTPFAETELNHLHFALDQILAEVKRQGLLTAQQLHQLDERLDYQKKSATWLGRVDWINGFTGAVLGQLLTWSLQPGVRETIAGIVGNALSWLLNPTPLIRP